MYRIVLESDTPIRVVSSSTETSGKISLRYTLEDMKRIAPGGRMEYLQFLSSEEAQQVMEDYGTLKNPLRLAHFFGQVGAETGGFKSLKESGNYSASRLRQIFPRYFTEAQAKAYAGNPVGILSRAYANRLGNGSEASRDGWNYRGTGWLQVTGKDNFQRFGITPDSNMLELLEASLKYWERLNLNFYADRNDRLAISRGVNVGNTQSSITPNGMSHRRTWFNRSWPVLRKYEKEHPINV